MDLGLKDKVVMVAASSKGLGYGIARQAALEGAKLSIGSRYENNIREAAEKLKKEVPGLQVHASTLDVADPHPSNRGWEAPSKSLAPSINWW